MDNVPITRQENPARNHGEPTHVIIPFAPFRPDGPTAQDFENTLLLGALESDYLPFACPAVAKLSQLYNAALGQHSKADSRAAVTADKGIHRRKLQMQIRQVREELTEANQRLAAFHLVDSVCWGIEMIETLVSNKPEMMREIASTMSSWPIEASVDANWSYIAEKLNHLKLGQHEKVRETEPPFHPAQGDETHLPARWWARQAVRCLAQTRDTQKRLATIPAARFVQRRCKIAPAPAWAKKALALPNLCAERQVLIQWASLIRGMIREQMPDFHNRAEWAQYRSIRSRTYSKKPGNAVTKGVAQNAILDDIVAALKTIAPRQSGKQQP